MKTLLEVLQEHFGNKLTEFLIIHKYFEALKNKYPSLKIKAFQEKKIVVKCSNPAESALLHMEKEKIKSELKNKGVKLEEVLIL